jgi:hypothetical protein
MNSDAKELLWAAQPTLFSDEEGTPDRSRRFIHHMASYLSCTRVSADVVRREPSGSAWDIYGKDVDGDLLTPSAWHGGVMGLLLDRSGPAGPENRVALTSLCS